ncbi:MAG: hypothetical protein ACR2NK_14990 [Mariniblastus sp.]
MRINNPILTILTCLVLSAMLILTNHLWDTQVATADGISPSSLQEGRFNPIQEEEEAEHEEEDEHEEDEHEEDDYEEEEHEFDREHEHGEIEGTLGQLEVIRQLADIAENDTATAAYALMQMEELLGEEDEAIEALNLLLKSNPAKPIKNLIRMKLAEIHLWSDQTEEATEVLMDLIRD